MTVELLGTISKFQGFQRQKGNIWSFFSTLFRVNFGDKYDGDDALVPFHRHPSGAPATAKQAEIIESQYKLAKGFLPHPTSDDTQMLLTIGEEKMALEVHNRFGRLIQDGHFPKTKASYYCRTYPADQTTYIRFWDVHIELKVAEDEEELKIFSNVIRQMNTDPSRFTETPETCTSAGYPSIKIAVFHLAHDVAKEFHKSHTILKDFVKTCMINRNDIITGDANQAANQMHTGQTFPHFMLSNFTHVLRQWLQYYSEISETGGINAFVETSSRSLDLRASYLHYKKQIDEINAGERDPGDFEQPSSPYAPDLDSMVTAVLCWDIFPAHKKARLKENQRLAQKKPQKQLNNLFRIEDLPKWLTNCSLMQNTGDQNWHLPLGISIAVRYVKPNASAIGQALKKTDNENIGSDLNPVLLHLLQQVLIMKTVVIALDQLRVPLSLPIRLPNSLLLVKRRNFRSLLT